MKLAFADVTSLWLSRRPMAVTNKCSVTLPRVAVKLIDMKKALGLWRGQPVKGGTNCYPPDESVVS
jgi:hypothetical protein